jgi:hypothetical protein
VRLIEWKGRGRSDPEEDHAFVLMVFEDLRGRLARRFIALHDAAQDPYDRDCWQDRVVNLRERVRGVDTSDADEVLACVEEWSEALEELDVFGPA